jgi:hypothetical protein
MNTADRSGRKELRKIGSICEVDGSSVVGTDGRVVRHLSIRISIGLGCLRYTLPCFWIASGVRTAYTLTELANNQSLLPTALFCVLRLFCLSSCCPPEPASAATFLIALTQGAKATKLQRQAEVLLLDRQPLPNEHKPA